METESNQETMCVDDDLKTDSDIFQEMSIDTPPDANSEVIPSQSQSKQIMKSPQKNDECNNDKPDGQNENISNILTTSNYHGEYHKALIDTLTRLLDGAFKKYLFSPYSTWLPLFEGSMKENSNKIMHFYPILLEELKTKISDHYLQEFEQIDAAQHLAYLQQKMAMTFYDENSETPKDTEPSSMANSFVQEEETEDQSISYKHPKRTQRDQQMMKINETFRNEIAALDQKIAMAEYKKNELVSQIEKKKKTLFSE